MFRLTARGEVTIQELVGRNHGRAALREDDRPTYLVGTWLSTCKATGVGFNWMLKLSIKKSGAVESATYLSSKFPQPFSRCSFRSVCPRTAHCAVPNNTRGFQNNCGGKHRAYCAIFDADLHRNRHSEPGATESSIFARRAERRTTAPPRLNCCT